MSEKLKLSLDVDQLHVESFQPQEQGAAARGTVRGNEATVDFTCYDATCRGYGTCGIYPCRPVP